PRVRALPADLRRADVRARATPDANAVSEYAWTPPESWVAEANATALAHSLGVEGYHELLALSISQPERFWDAVARDPAIPFTKPYERVLDTSDGPAWARWFGGGELNLTNACVERWADDPAHA